MPRPERALSEEELEARFEGIAQQAIEEAEAEPIPFEQFVAGLHIMAIRIKDRERQAAEELAARNRE